MMTTVRQILTRKPDIYAVAPHATVYEALQLMADKNIGAVLVMEGDVLRGIFSERDYARRGILEGNTSRDTAVRAVMTSDIVTVDPGATIATCMALMTDKRIRHLPVADTGRVVGIVSIGDVVRAIVDEQQFTIRSLEHYLTS